MSVTKGIGWEIKKRSASSTHMKEWAVWNRAPARSLTLARHNGFSEGLFVLGILVTPVASNGCHVSFALLGRSVFIGWWGYNFPSSIAIYRGEDIVWLAGANAPSRKWKNNDYVQIFTRFASLITRLYVPTKQAHLPPIYFSFATGRIWTNLSFFVKGEENAIVKSIYILFRR